jgi:hypothetical protein
MIERIGFTGTQQGMTSAQRYSVEELLQKLGGNEFHHGDCIGADAQAHGIAYRIGYRIHIHPPVVSTKRAYCFHYDLMYTLKPYLDRNHDIVDACQVLVATPKEFDEQLRSGTWATIRYARKRGVRVFLVLPDGRTVQ